MVVVVINVTGDQAEGKTSIGASKEELAVVVVVVKGK